MRIPATASRVGPSRDVRALCRAMLVVLAVAAACAPAAQAEWSAPVTVSAAHGAIDPVRLATGPAGALLTWTYYDFVPPTFQGFGPASEGAAFAAPGGPFGPEGRLPAGYATGPLVSIGGGRVAQLLSVAAGVNTSIPEVVLGRVGKGFGAPLRVGPSVRSVPGRASVAGDARGDVVLAWIRADRYVEHRVVWVSVRPAGGRFGVPRRVSGSANAEQVTTAMGPNGEAVVAFATHGRMLATVRHRGTTWGPLQQLGPAAVDTENDVTPSVLSNGRVIVAWYHVQLTAGGSIGPGALSVAVQPAGADRFRRAQVLTTHQSLAGAPGGVSLAPAIVQAGGHRPLLAFLANASATNPNAVVNVAHLDGATFGASRTISATDQQAGPLAAASGPRGVVVTWTADQSPWLGLGNVFAARSNRKTGALEVPEQVSLTGGVSVGKSVAVALDAAANRWVIAWVRSLPPSAVLPGTPPTIAGGGQTVQVSTSAS